MPKIESEKIDCLHRPCSRPAPRGKIKSVRTHSEVIEQFGSFSLLKLLFLARNWHCWSRKACTRQMTPQIREETAKTAVFDSADRHEKLYGWSRLYASAQGRHETGGLLSLFSSLSFDISIKNSMQRWSSDFQGLFCVKIRKMAQGSSDLSTLPLRNVIFSFSDHFCLIFSWKGRYPRPYNFFHKKDKTILFPTVYFFHTAWVSNSSKLRACRTERYLSFAKKTSFLFWGIK